MKKLLPIFILVFAFSAFGQSEDYRKIPVEAGDTITSIAKRNGVKPEILAKLNGLPVSSKLEEGSEIKIPFTIGVKPVQYKNGKVPVIINYFRDDYRDPASIRYVRWGKVKAEYFSGGLYWSVEVQLRAKDEYGAPMIFNQTFFIWNNNVVGTK